MRREALLRRLRKLVFAIRKRTGQSRLADSLRRVNRLARLMSVMQGRPGGKADRESKTQGPEQIVPPPKMDGPAGDSRG
jgi:hypothetical protein